MAASSLTSHTATSEAPGVSAEVIEGHPEYGRPPMVPKAVLRFARGGAAADALYKELAQGADGGPRINALRQRDDLIFNPMSLEPGEAETIAERVADLLSAAR